MDAREERGLIIAATCRLNRMRDGTWLAPSKTKAGDVAAYPPLLDLPAPELASYPRETVVAEKFQAMVVLGIANSRMKDFFDLWVLARSFEFDGPVLANAIQATFARRKTPIPGNPPLALTVEFGTDKAKVAQWKAFLKKGKLDAGGMELVQVCEFLARFLLPLTHALVRKMKFTLRWPAGGPWEPVP